MESVSGLVWIGRGETRALVLLAVGITGTVATAVKGWALERSPTSPGRRRRLRELRNVVLLPPMGSATAQTRTATARLCAEKVIAVRDRREPPAVVV
jgi:lactate dehydrogenase-like 2-hydroxyacid dehydrogenase